MALLLTIASVSGILRAYRSRRFAPLAALLLFDAAYVFTGVYCIVRQLLVRIATYSGMTNHEIFYYVVQYLREMGQGYPGGETMVRILDFDTVTFGYIMANIEVYIAPLTVILLLGFVQWRITRRLKRNPSSGKL